MFASEGTFLLRFLRHKTSLIMVDCVLGFTEVNLGLDSGIGAGIPLGVCRSKNYL